MATAGMTRPRRRLTRYRPELVHGARMTVASITAYALVHALGLSEGLWAVITAIIVTQSSIGGSLKVASDQLLGSLLGAAYATVIALLISPDDRISSVLALVATLAPLSVLAAHSAGFRIAPITGAIILLGDAGLEIGPIGFATNRILEVGLGSGVGILVSVLVVPAKASRSALETSARLANLMAEQLAALASGRHAAQTDLAGLCVRSRNELIRLELLAEEAASERQTRLTDLPDLKPLLRTMRRLRHNVGMLRRTAQGTGHDLLDEHVGKPWRCAIEAGVASLRTTGRLLCGQKVADDPDGLAKAVRGYRKSLDGMRRGEMTQTLSTAALGRLFGMGFALDQLRRDLDELTERSEEIAAARHTHGRALFSTAAGP